MDDRRGPSDQYRRVSPWPLFVALGLALSEVGVLLVVVPLSVGGLVLFTGSVAGILREAGYVERPWDLLAVLGALLVVVGAALVAGQADPLTVDRLLALLRESLGARPNAMVIRGLSVLAAGLVAAVAGLAAALYERGPTGADAV